MAFLDFFSSDKKNSLLLIFIILLASCDGGSDSESDDNLITQIGGCTAFNLNIAPNTNSLTTYVCGSTGSGTDFVMSQLNQFWGSSVTACSCQADAFSAGCTNNAFVSPSDIGYIFYDANYQNQLDVTTGSPAAADFLMAHEFGHNIKLGLGLFTVGKQTELQADCLAGYYFGFKTCRTEVTEQEILDAFNYACSIGDPFISSFWQEGSHGTCAERVAAARRGFEFYRSGALPGNACP